MALLSMQDISKTFPGVKALDQVNLDVQQGEIHAVVGENGAGKSTLMKILSGVYPHGSYDGKIQFDGAPAQFANISDSERQGIIIIHQELALVPQLSISENIFLGNERAKSGVINWRETNRRTEELLAKVGLAEAPSTLVDNIGVGKQQLVEIAKALSKQVKLLILDEPTAALQENDSRKLLDLMLELKAQGVTSIIISHKLNEVRYVADTVTVIRDGMTVSRLDAKAGLSEDEIVRDMVGREMTHRFPEHQRSPGKLLLEVKNWDVWHPEHTGRQVIRDVSFAVRAGEVVGIAGLMGSGRTELAMSIFGRSYGRNISGSVKLNDNEIDVSTVDKAISAGISYVTEDRKSLGLVLDETIRFNTTLANLEGVSSGSVLKRNDETKVAEKFKKALAIRTPSVFQKTVNLSGGNQQKVVLAKWLFTEPEVLILDEPTRGIDVGAKYEIYTIINDLADQGKGVVMISSEMPELLGMCDRIYVMNEGALVGELNAEDASQERIMSLIVNE
ncbi:putative multiple sugar transport system ATP-binding protein [Labrenzia sp. EL_208]|uniref:Xylose import ATP-binding protein XylG n=1 Tax=Roseibium album TaxID=311410 RepID=A0A0M6ZKU9_9HYPH|nr:multiple monosaccharide ABC transporter ATP-binding protein [Roseibium album]MBG6148520.1 putative multiple sugar transport system ATP-binding protein [Labrenzia sp. EL_142]MBG6154633.1 putative multiple sugar transport system ATP-binding protein [Labrenzia sp. EL_162]MBG6161912.1 putative multiple sugar transport system ATP-binding protein [Labrenzia sp. EL_195]MBG6176332.1 putative multiple sugar transport system ATP-binding protein [Labrenzia sp. EL_132]MBG6193237.1 putative multiple sug